MRNLPDVQPFLFPVNAKSVPDYYNIVVRPMDLQTMRELIRQKKYQTREEFLSDVNQIVENSTLYNGKKRVNLARNQALVDVQRSIFFLGAKSSLTLAAKRMLQVCVDRLAEKEDKMMRLEKAINPLLDDDDQVALSYILDSIVSKLKKMSESWPFVKPVNKKAVKDYYDVVKHPMDLETICNNVKGSMIDTVRESFCGNWSNFSNFCSVAHKYHSRREFLRHIELILNNCIIYNGRESSYTERAETLLKTAQASLEEVLSYFKRSKFGSMPKISDGI